MPLLRCVDCWYNPTVFFMKTGLLVKIVPEQPFRDKSTHDTEFRVFFFGKIAVGVVAV
jgi:hypothetical protein